MNNQSKGNENEREGGNVLRVMESVHRHRGHVNTTLVSHEKKKVCVGLCGRAECISHAFRPFNLWFCSEKTRQVAYSAHNEGFDF